MIEAKKKAESDCQKLNLRVKKAEDLLAREIKTSKEKLEFVLTYIEKLSNGEFEENIQSYPGKFEDENNSVKRGLDQMKKINKKLKSQAA